MKPTLANLRKLVESHGGKLDPDGCGGYDVLADQGTATMRWIDEEVWCQPLPLGEYDRAEWPDLIQSVMDGCSLGVEPFGD